jgi:hypothetical protein
MKKTLLSAIPATVFFLLLAFCCQAGEPPQTPSGTYISKADSKEYLSLYPDGTFFLKQRKPRPDIESPFKEITGKYRLSGEDIKLELPDGGEASGKIKGNTFEDGDGKPWVKQGTELPPPVERAKRPK